eukprot:COSAG02_NODE_338_length_24206_cov_94.612685_4_plen_189_part_00
MTDFQNRAKFPIKSAKSLRIGAAKAAHRFTLSIQYWMQKGCCTPFGNRPAATGTVDWVARARARRKFKNATKRGACGFGSSAVGLALGGGSRTASKSGFRVVNSGERTRSGLSCACVPNVLRNLGPCQRKVGEAHASRSANYTARTAVASKLPAPPHASKRFGRAHAECYDALRGHRKGEICALMSWR